MTSLEILEGFAAKMTQIYLYQREMQELTQNELRKLGSSEKCVGKNQLIG